MFPDDLISPISYFLRGNENSLRGINELVAETNLIINIPQTDNAWSARTALLQQYFPKSIAYIAKELNKLEYVSLDTQTKNKNTLTNLCRLTNGEYVKYQTPYIDPKTNMPIDNASANLLSIKLINDIINGRIKIEELSDNHILDIWSRKHYERLKNFTYLLEEYIVRFDKICQNNTISLDPKDGALRTISIGNVLTEGNFSLGKPGWPAAAARVRLIDLEKTESEKIYNLIKSRVEKDKFFYVIKNLEDKKNTRNIESSTIFVIIPDEGKELIGFDWAKTGSIYESGFGSKIFRENIDENNCSTEVTFPSTAKFKKIRDSEVVDCIQKDKEGNIYEYKTKIIFVKPIY